MTKKQTIVLVIVALLVLGLLIYLGSSNKSVVDDQTEGEDSAEESSEPVGEEVAPGSSLIDEEGKVVDDEGEEVDNSADPGSSSAPRQSDPITEEDTPEEALKLEVSASGYSPSTFEVDSGRAVTITVTSVDDQTHIFKFKDESLKGVAVGIAPGETRAISFNAPASGEYDFYCDVPGHEARGETGTMIVK